MLGILEQVTDAVRQRILEQAFKPGERLTIDRIARELGVSPTPVREALGRLQGEGLLVYRRSQGYQVTPVSVRELQEMLDCRLAIEPFAARAIDPISDDLLRGLEMIQTRFRQALDARRISENNTADREFHETIVGAAGNAMLLRLFRSMNSHMYTMRLFYYTEPVRERELEETWAEHCAIMDAFKARSQAAAAEAIAEHLRRVKQRVAVHAPKWMAQAAPDGATPRGTA